MDKQLVEMVTKLVVEKLAATEQSLPPTTEVSNSQVDNVHSNGLIQLLPYTSSQSYQPKQVERKQSTTTAIAKPFVEKFNEKTSHVRSKTPARIGVGRSGSRPLTNTVLKFRFDHAAAVDAVYGEVESAILEKLNLFTIHTRAETDKETYILRPDYGRKLTEQSKNKLYEQCKKQAQVQIIVSNGLSASAINANLENVFHALNQSLAGLGLAVGTPFYIEQGRVALMDDIGEILQPDVIVYLIGERPGLASAESMSAYICYKPRHGTIESDRTVVSNIHKGGIPPVEAGAYLGNLIKKILKFEASGVNLVKKEG